jgi:hypothetical protein
VRGKVCKYKSQLRIILRVFLLSMTTLVLSFQGSAQSRFPFDTPRVDTILLTGCLYSSIHKKDIGEGGSSFNFVPHFFEQMECEELTSFELDRLEVERDFLCFLSGTMRAYSATSYFRNSINYTILDYSNFSISETDWDYKSNNIKVKQSYVTFRAWRYKMSIPQVGEFLNLNYYSFQSDSTTVYILREILPD